MGMYTEFIFGAQLKKDTPDEVIEVLKYMYGDSKEEKTFSIDHPFFKSNRWDILFKMSSYYFGYSSATRDMYFDDISEAWIISVRSNLKNYGNEISLFCDWIKPYIYSGSGNKNIYCMSLYEDSEEYVFYSLE